LTFDSQQPAREGGGASATSAQPARNSQTPESPAHERNRVLTLTTPMPGAPVKSIISTVPGFISYSAFRKDGGGQTVTVCQDKAGTDESSRRAADWVKENISVTVDPPAVSEGGTVLHF